jgi:hypothetical protein
MGDMQQLIRFRYPLVDTDRQQVTVELLHENEVLMVVVLDLLSGEMHKKGSLERLQVDANELDGLFSGLWANARYMLQMKV